jgi:farnesyl diphosphate synthase
VNVEPDFIKYQQRVNQFLTHYLSEPTPLSKPLHDAMCYAVLNGGKRLRPLLVYTLGVALGSPLESLDQVACALELIHAYSLIHDDLPSMDNDDWRRGKPSCHKKFGEPMALLAGDSLQTLAFDVLLKAPLSAAKIVKMLNVLVKAAGPWGMVAGQAMEFSSSLSCADKSSVESIHTLKTGALFAASLELAGIIADLSKQQLLTLAQIGNKLGLVYQLQDDVCDDECSLYWQDLTIRETYLQGLVEQILKDLTFIFPFSSPKKQVFNRLLKTIFQFKEAAIIY